MSTVPMFAPTGELGDIPADKMAAAAKAGFQPGVHVKSADGQDGVIPAHRTADAVKAGMTIVPIQDQPIQHEGFWSTLGSDLGGMIQSAAPPTTKEGLLAKVKMFKEAIAGRDPKEAIQNVIDRANAGHGLAYSALAAPAAEGLGVNVKGMEQSAQQGDVGGVYGHAAAVPTAMATGEVLGRLPLGRIAKAGGGALVGGAEKLPIVGPVGKGMIRGAVKSWRGSAPPDVEIPPSKVSTTPPESVSKATQLQQSKALQNVPTPQAPPTSAVRDMSTILPQLQAIAKKIQEQGTPAEASLEPALQKSLQPRIEGKIMQVLRKEGTGSTLSVNQLMKDTKLQGYSQEQVLNAAKSLRDQGKIWHDQTGSVALKARK